MVALLLICAVVLAIDIIVCVLADWIVSAELHGGFIRAWKFKRYWKRLNRY